MRRYLQVRLDYFSSNVSNSVLVLFSFHQVVVSMVVKLKEVASISRNVRADIILVLDQRLVHRVVK